MHVLFCRNEKCRSIHEDVKMCQKKLAIIKIINLIAENIMVWISDLCTRLVRLNTWSQAIICRLCETLGTWCLVVRYKQWKPLMTDQQGPVSASWWTTAVWPDTLWSCKHALLHPCLILSHSPPWWTRIPWIHASSLNLLVSVMLSEHWESMEPSLKWLTWHRKMGRRSQVEVEGTRDTLETGLFWYLLEIA